MGCSFSRTPEESLWWASSNQAAPEVVDTILRQEGVNVNSASQYGYTALHKACANRASKEVVKLLLEHGARASAIDRWGSTPLHAACKNKAPPEVVQLLLDSGASINAVTHDGSTPLHLACRKHAPFSTVELLLDRGALVNGRANDGSTPLHWACMKKASPDVVRLLLERGADPNAARKDGKTPLIWAARWNAHSDVVQILVDHGANAQQIDVMGRTALDWARHRKHPELVRALSDPGIQETSAALRQQEQVSMALDLGTDPVPAEHAEGIHSGSEKNTLAEEECGREEESKKKVEADVLLERVLGRTSIQPGRRAEYKAALHREHLVNLDRLSKLTRDELREELGFSLGDAIDFCEAVRLEAAVEVIEEAVVVT